MKWLRRLANVLGWIILSIMAVVAILTYNPFCTLLTVTSDSMDPVFYAGDMVCVTKGVDKIEVGDVVVFNSPRGGEPIIHRVVAIDGEILTTKGDACENPDIWFEGSVTKSDVSGKYVNNVKIPKLGYVFAGIRQGIGWMISSVSAEFTDQEKASGTIAAPLFTPEPTEEPMLLMAPEPSPTPEPTPTIEPSPIPEPAPEVTPEPTLEPTPIPTLEPEPTPKPTEEPILIPKATETPSPTPTIEPSPSPEPTPEVTPEPTLVPKSTETPKPTPTVEPTPTPTVEPTVKPTPEPTREPEPEELVLEMMSVAEVTPEPTPELTPEPTPKPTPEPEPIPEPEVAPEPTSETN